MKHDDDIEIIKIEFIFFLKAINNFNYNIKDIDLIVNYLSKNQLDIISSNLDIMRNNISGLESKISTNKFNI